MQKQICQELQFTGGVACNGNTSNNPHLVVGGTGNIVNSSAVLQCKGFIRVAQYVLIHQNSSSSSIKPSRR